MTDKIVGIVAKKDHPRSSELADQIIKKLNDLSIKYVLETHTAERLKADGFSYNPLKIVDKSEICAETDPIIILGGDGTLISVCHFATTKNNTVVGVNLGTLGFLTEITVAEMLPILEQVLQGSAKTEKRSLLSCKLTEGKSTEHHKELKAFNDIVITKGTLSRVFGIEVYIDNEFATTIQGDGIIIASPCGSTAYSLAAGGSIVHPQVEALLITPICPHSLNSRPLVVPGKSTIRLKLSSRAPDETIFLTSDGQQGEIFTKHTEAIIKLSDDGINFAKSPSKNYFEVLANKLHWGTRS